MISSSPSRASLVAIAVIIAWLLYILLSLDLSANSPAASAVAKSTFVLATAGIAFALYRSAGVRRLVGAIAVVMSAFGLVSLIGAAISWITDAPATAMESHSIVGFVLSVFVHAFIAWAFLFSHRSRRLKTA